jgi:hypothetical protein
LAREFDTRDTFFRVSRIDRLDNGREAVLINDFVDLRGRKRPFSGLADDVRALLELEFGEKNFFKNPEDFFNVRDPVDFCKFALEFIPGKFTGFS